MNLPVIHILDIYYVHDVPSHSTTSQPYFCLCFSHGFVSPSGLQVAMGMQKDITARREQIDSLHGRIQHLEETMEKLHQVKSLMYCCLCRFFTGFSPAEFIVRFLCSNMFLKLLFIVISNFILTV